MNIEELSGCHRADVMAYVEREWGLPIVTRGNSKDPQSLPGFCAVCEDGVAGAILYQITGDSCEIVVLYALFENRGVGSRLMDTVVAKAREAGCRRVWLITMNDNTRAIRFYQKWGFSLKAVHINAFKVTQQIKGLGEGVIPGIDGIPILHEFEFEILL